MCYIASDDREFDTVIKKNAIIKLHSHAESAMPSEAQKKCEKIQCRILCHPAGRSAVQKHNWGSPHAPKKRTAHIQVMLTKLMLTNLQDFVSKKSSNKSTKNMVQTMDTIL